MVRARVLPASRSHLESSVGKSRAGPGRALGHSLEALVWGPRSRVAPVLSWSHALGRQGLAGGSSLPHVARAAHAHTHLRHSSPGKRRTEDGRKGRRESEWGHAEGHPRPGGQSPVQAQVAGQKGPLTGDWSIVVLPIPSHLCHWVSETNQVPPRSVSAQHQGAGAQACTECHSPWK